MNKNRRERLDKAWAIVQEVLEEEEAAFYNLPDSLQYAEGGEKMQDAISLLQEVAENLETIVMD